MKNLKILFYSLLFISCSQLKEQSQIPANLKNLSDQNVQIFEFKDLTGEYNLKKEVKIQDKKLFIKKTLFEKTKSEFEPLEKNITVSQIGNVKIKGKNYPILRPFASQHTVWLDKKRHFVETKTDTKTKKMIVRMESPSKKWNGKKSIKYPAGNTFCYFSQLIECIQRTGFIEFSIQNKKGEMPLYIIWDTYPYITEQYANMNAELFSSAKFNFNEVESDGYKFSLETEEHEIYYHFDKNFIFTKMFWISQGISQIRI